MKYPTAYKTLRVLEALTRGERLTVARALQDLGVYALSQEVGRLKKLGWKIDGCMMRTSPGVMVKEYWLAARDGL